MAPRVVTVTGPVPPERIGFTLPHEHTSCRPELVRTRQELIDFTSDAEVMTDELHDFRRRGGSCIVDLTCGGLARDPIWLRNLATRSGLFIVMGALQVLTTLAGYLNPRLRLLEDEVPEVTPDEAPASALGGALDGVLTEST